MDMDMKMTADLDDRFDSDEEEDLEEDLMVQAATIVAVAVAVAVVKYLQTYYINMAPEQALILRASEQGLIRASERALMSCNWSAGPFATLASGWAPESAYGKPTSRNYAHETSSPQRSSCHDEYNPSSDNTPPLVSAISSAPDVHTTPSRRCSSVTISRNTRDALHTFYERIYGPDSKRCAVTQKKERLEIAHIVQRTSSPDQLSLYEYCLGCDWQTFDVDNRRNLAYLSLGLHDSFDADDWLLLPDLSTLQEIESFVQSVLTARQDASGSTPIDTFLSKWNTYLKTTYTFMPLPGLSHYPILRMEPGQSESYEVFDFPFNSFPPLECHVSPPLAVINGGPKLADLDLDAISLTYHRQESNETQIATKERLTLMRSIWGLIMGAKDLAKEWENENRGKNRKRDQDDGDIGRLSKRNDRIRRSIAKSQPNSKPIRQAIGGTQSKEILGTRKRDWKTMNSSTTLTGDVLAQLGKRQKTVDSIKEWVESTTRRLPK